MDSAWHRQWLRNEQNEQYIDNTETEKNDFHQELDRKITSRYDETEDECHWLQISADEQFYTATSAAVTQCKIAVCMAQSAGAPAGQ